MGLPPGQRELGRFPRFGAHLVRPIPLVPAAPSIEIRGAVNEAFEVPLSRLDTLPRRELTADFHCVTGWSATGLRWEGVALETVYRALIEPALRPGATVTHLLCRGLDGYRSVISLEDALADDVLIAQRLDGRPLDGDHGAPARLVSPRQYGYVNTKHLCRIELHTSEPQHTTSSRVLRLLGRHPRARVWEEERHRHLPAWAVRHVYRGFVAPIAYLSSRGTKPAPEGPSIDHS